MDFSGKIHTLVYVNGKRRHRFEQGFVSVLQRVSGKEI
tara:strand:- start:13457 stop:13570 length:114 start_codon:yes stop_codon:yes gene_type:complete